MADEYRVVVADDEPRFIELFHTLLDGVEDIRIVGEACNGTEALKLARELLPDGMIIDLYMPDMNGLEVIREIKAQLPTIRTVLVSSYWDRGTNAWRPSRAMPRLSRRPVSRRRRC